MAAAAKEALGVDHLAVVADSGYYNGDTLKACEDNAITAYVAQPDRGRRQQDEGRFTLEDFVYDAAADLYRCPAGSPLRPLPRPRRQQSGKLVRRYLSSRPVCRGCPLRQQCLSKNRDRREIERWVHQEVIDRHRERMQTRGKTMMRRRKSLAEHPFGTLKCRAGYRHFLLRGVAKVRGEWNLMALCYNFARVLNLLGPHGWRAALAQRAPVPIAGPRNTRARLSAHRHPAAGILPPPRYHTFPRHDAAC